ncbi:hypothetical protein ACLB2K_054068 [Fragaria x ananassa]
MKDVSTGSLEKLNSSLIVGTCSRVEQYLDGQCVPFVIILSFELLGYGTMQLHAAASSGNDYRSHNLTSGGRKTNSIGSAIRASSSIKWLPPPCNLVKLNFDGSVCHNKKAAAGFVIRDHEGNPILAGSRCVGNTSVPIAECSALRDGLFHAFCNDIRRVQVEGDSKLIIDLINNRSPLLGDSVLSLVMLAVWHPIHT